MFCFALLSFGASIFLVPSLVSALGFECVNGFRDTANAVATVVYTITLKRWIANSARVHVSRRGSVRLWTLCHLSRPRRALKREDVTQLLGCNEVTM